MSTIQSCQDLGAVPMPLELNVPGSRTQLQGGRCIDHAFYR